MTKKYDYILYPLTILLSTLLNVFMVIFAVIGVLILVKADLPEFIPLKIGTLGYFIFAFLCFGLDKLMFSIRTNSKNRIEFDEDGNKKNNLYKNLSAADKAIIDKQVLADKERLLGEAEIKRVIHNGVKNPEEELEKLIGLYNVKEEIKKMKATMEYNRKYEKNKKQNVASNHMCFVGSPGTGKTTVARIMTGLLYKYKYIKKNQCIEVDASFLKGDTPDNTLKKTKLIIAEKIIFE